MNLSATLKKLLPGLLIGLAFASAVPTALAQEDPSELRRLADDQRKLAEQARRLETLLETLEARERAAGRETKADLLAGARKRLSGAEGSKDLVSILESIAGDLGELRAGTALETQAEVIDVLRDLLDFLLERQQREQLESLLENAKARREALENMAAEQRRLLDRTRELLHGGDPEGGASRDGERSDLAQEQGGLNEDLRDFANRDRESGIESGNIDRAAEAGEEAESHLDPDADSSSQSESQSGNQGSQSQGSENANESQSGESESNPSGENAGERSEGESDGREGESEPPEGSEASESGESQSGESESSESNASESEGQPAESESSSSESPPSESSASSPGQQSESEGQSQGQTGDQPSPRQPQSPQDRQSRPRSPSQGAQPLSPSEQRELEQAEEAQERALDAIESAADRAREEEQQLQDMQRQEELLDLIYEATLLRERHLRIEKLVADYFEHNPGYPRPNRSDRVQFRKWATEQKQIAADTAELSLQVRERGADSVPFIMGTLREDHERLGMRLGPPQYLAGEDELALSYSLSKTWEDLIEALRREAERERQRLQNPQQGGDGQQPEEEEDPPLVSFAAEVQLLRIMQEHLQGRMERLERRRAILNKAGIEIDADDLAEIDQIVERQSKLRALFEAIVTRLQEGETPIANEEEV